MDSESKTSDADADADGSRLSDPPTDSDNDSDSDSSAAEPTEWLATTRQRRATAGNRMKAVLAHQEPDSDLELLFAEDDNDQGFSTLGEDASDVQMDSSTDDDDDDDDDARGDGDQELERQVRGQRAAQRKRGAQTAIPAKFRKRVRIDASTPAAPAPRPKKSERTSWLPSPADLPTRASSRQTTRISKEQLHQQMVEREARRLKQLSQMHKKAARLEAMKKPPMTQEQRLAEAAVVERRNSKSLNRWEEAEKQREEERRAKLAALQGRTLTGPVITFWSGVRRWKDALGQHVTMVEARPKKKRDKGTAPAPAGESTLMAKPCSDTRPTEGAPAADPMTTPSNRPAKDKQLPMPLSPPRPAPPAPSSGLAAPVPPPQSTGPLASPPGMCRPRDARPSGVLAAPVMAPLPGIDVGATRPTGGAEPNVVARPSTPQQPEPLSVQAPGMERRPGAPGETPLQQTHDEATPAKTSASPGPSEAPRAPDAARGPPTARNAIIYRNFDQNALRDKSVQTQILFGRKMTRLPKPTPAPHCVITNQAARYRDPKTGLAYYDASAYREIQRLCQGDYRWSRLLGAWVGSGTMAARGVPPRFLHPGPEVPKRAQAKAGADTKPATSGPGPAREDAPAPAADNRGAAAAVEE